MTRMTIPTTNPMQSKPIEPLRRRNPWPIALVAYFVVFITFIVGFTLFAMRQRMDLVSHDYYEEEIHFQKQVDRLTRTQSLKTDVALNYDSDHRVVTVALPREHATSLASASIRFYRPSDARLDRKVDLQARAGGIEPVPVGDLRDGLWKVRVEWTLDGQEYFHDEPLIIAARRRNIIEHP